MSPTILEFDPVTIIPLIGEKFSKLLKNLDIKIVGDLLRHYPNRYADFSTRSTVDQLQAGETVTISGTISSFAFRPTRKRGFTIQEAVIADSTGTIKLLWFNQPYIRTILTKGTTISVAGVVESENGKLLFKNPEYEILKAFIHTGRIVPIYPETKGISSKWLRSKLALLTGILDWYQHRYDIVSTITEWIPDFVLKEEKLISVREAFQQVHFPSSFQKLEEARKRLGFDELLTQHLLGQYRKLQWKQSGNAKPIHWDEAEIQTFIQKLPYQLTDDQQRALSEILSDLSKTTPMNRLLQGDVGSGKTVMAAIASFSVIQAGYQVALMVPTQVLADQHAETLTALLKPFGIKIALLTGAVKGIRGKGQGAREINPDLIIGTHALIHKRATQLIDKDRLALVIIDEQHRFGVQQRAKFVESGKSLHVLSMTATPIPRTIALTLYGNLDVSSIQTMPQGRIPVKTWVVSESKREAAYQWIREQLTKDHQAFVVCPLIEGSFVESLQDVKAVVKEFDSLKRVFSNLRLALLHGKIPAPDKYSILSQMKEGKLDVLVTTPVVEVGVDIPNATLMIIEGADRFGLAQLHQLRGRVGRRAEQSYCLLFPTSPKASRRLKVLETVYNGLELSELDLKQRGPGEIYSTEQHGWPHFKIADITNVSKVQHSYHIAALLVQQLDSYPTVKQKVRLLDKSIALN